MLIPNLLQTLLQNVYVLLAIKVIILLMILLLTIYSFVVRTQIRSLNRLVFIHAKNASKSIILFSTIYLLVCISLFFLALVIL